MDEREVLDDLLSDLGPTYAVVVDAEGRVLDLVRVELLEQKEES